MIEPKGGVLVTVGTTSFDDLVAAAATAAFAQRLKDLGYEWLRIQVRCYYVGSNYLDY